jgi:hypothetical protein
MADSSAVVQAVGWRAVSRYQWLVFLVVWAGWTLDAADFSLFALVLKPALTNLLGFPVAGALDVVQTAQIWQGWRSPDHDRIARLGCWRIYFWRFR